MQKGTLEAIAQACHISTDQATAVLEVVKTNTEKQRALRGLDGPPEDMEVTVADGQPIPAPR